MKSMKKILALCLVVATAVVVTSCGKNATPSDAVEAELKGIQTEEIKDLKKSMPNSLDSSYDKQWGDFLKKIQDFDYKVKDEIKADIFTAGDKIDATAISKGKGFQGAIKRFGQSRGPMAHGSKFHRHQGSNGSATTPGRVKKGKGMPGHMGSKRITIQNLQVVRVDADKNLILVRGAVPGPRKALVTIKETSKVSK